MATQHVHQAIQEDNTLVKTERHRTKSMATFMLEANVEGAAVLAIAAVGSVYMQRNGELRGRPSERVALLSSLLGRCLIIAFPIVHHLLRLKMISVVPKQEECSRKKPPNPSLPLSWLLSQRHRLPLLSPVSRHVCECGESVEIAASEAGRIHQRSVVVIGLPSRSLYR